MNAKFMFLFNVLWCAVCIGALTESWQAAGAVASAFLALAFLAEEYLP